MRSEAHKDKVTNYNLTPSCLYLWKRHFNYTYTKTLAPWCIYALLHSPTDRVGDGEGVDDGDGEDDVGAVTGAVISTLMYTTHITTTVTDHIW